MKKFVFLVILPLSLLFVFISGYLPYTLIYNDSSLKNAGITAAEAVTAQARTCKVQDTKGSRLGIELETTFFGKLRNNTDRFVAISAIGEVFSAAGYSAGAKSKLLILFPNAEREIRFRSLTLYSRTGGYNCKLRYAVGSFQYW